MCSGVTSSALKFTMITEEPEKEDEVEEGEKLEDLLEQFEYSVHSFNVKDYSKESDEMVRIARVENIVEAETEELDNLRASKSTTMCSEMLERQANEILEAFSEPNYLRAELADLAPRSSSRIFLIPKYVRANIVELRSRRRYKAIVLASALRDARNGLTNEQWVFRVEGDIQMVNTTKEINDRKEKDLVLRKRRAYDFNRAKSILKADLLALRTAWPWSK